MVCPKARSYALLILFTSCLFDRRLADFVYSLLLLLLVSCVVSFMCGLGGILSNLSCDFYVMIFKILFNKKNISTS